MPKISGLRSEGLGATEYTDVRGRTLTTDLESDCVIYNGLRD